MTVETLCAVIMFTAGIDGHAAERGCALAPEIVESAARERLDPLVITAVAWKESNFSSDKIGGSGECGPMQVLPRVTKPRMTCQELQGPGGVAAGANALRRWLKSYPSLSLALEHYNCGYRDLPKCGRYSRNVTKRVSALRRALRNQNDPNHPPVRQPISIGVESDPNRDPG